MTETDLRLSLLELTLAGSRAGPERALAALRRTTRLAEDLGLHRVWITEHHEHQTIAQQPELFLPLLAAQTKRIRIGVAGVLLHYRSPFMVAEAFATLSASFPDRLDLGLARGRVDPAYAVALLDGDHPEEAERRSPYPVKVARLVTLLTRAEAGLLPHAPVGLQIWVLGSGSTSRRLADDLRLPYCHAAFLPVSRTARAKTLAVAGICAASDERAEAALRHAPRAIVCEIVGSPERCARRIRELARASGAEEIVFADMNVDSEDHLRSIESLAEALQVPDRR